VGDIAHGFGYRSQASFTHAFMARFGATPSRFRRDFTRWPNKPIDGITDRRITVRECEPVHCLARRYFGPYRNVPENWIDFVARLPTDLKSHGLFFGLTYDDPRFTPADQIRYDCCVTLGRGPLEDEDVLTSKGFHRLATRPGLYAAVEHRGCYATGIGSSYSLILDHWGANNPRHTIGDDPGIEIYTTPPGIGAPETLVGTITVPLV
jgi:AraC family transcriptional regulator